MIDKRAWMVVLAIVLMTLTGCGAENVGLSDEQRDYMQVLPDGTQVRCVYITQGTGQSSTGGPSCDWVGYHKAYDAKP